MGAPTATGRFQSPDVYTPKHLAEKILTSKSALEGERKQVTVLFADLKGSMELLADRDPEEARKLLDPVPERMMEAVHRYEGTLRLAEGYIEVKPLGHEPPRAPRCVGHPRLGRSHPLAGESLAGPPGDRAPTGGAAH